MSTKTKKTRTAARHTLAALCATVAITAVSERASAQEILLTGPLAGAPAVRKLKLYRQGRFEVAPAFSFTLLDEYQRQIFMGARLNYNLTDWFAIGVWGGFSPSFFKITTGLAENIQQVNTLRRREDANRPMGPGTQPTTTFLATQRNLGQDFTKQLGTMDWIAAPQITLTPFRGKIA